MDFVIMSHLRWGFVFQRPQHLLTRCAKKHRVFFWEEPVFDARQPFLQISGPLSGLTVAVPHLPPSLSEDTINTLQQSLVAQLLTQFAIRDYVLWYYTPMALSYTRNLSPAFVVYDCMDELSAFRGAPPGLREAEMELFRCANVIFTGGQTLYEAKRNQHRSVHCFPSSIDREFFARARTPQPLHPDQIQIPNPRIGYCGVIDERMDFGLIRAVAHQRPDWHIVMVGPVVKVDESELPRLPNIHYLGGKQYGELPSLMAGWDVGLLPFVLNESTRFISPTKTPEYLAAGLPVVSTAIADVVRPYGLQSLVHIAESPDDFINGIEMGISVRNSAARIAKVDAFLSRNSWDKTWEAMAAVINSERSTTSRTFSAVSCLSMSTANINPVVQPSAAND